MSEKEKKAQEKADETLTKDAEETQKENVQNSSAETTEASEEKVDEEVKTETEEKKDLTPEEQILSLKQEIESLKKEKADLKDQVLRRVADFDNYRKRMIQEKQEAFDYANTSLLKDLLDSLDNFDRTVDAAQNAQDPKVIADGVKMINKSLVSMLENKYNLVAYGSVGEEFNPDLHEAIGMQEGDVENEQLAAVYLKGYKLKDRVIRHAKVMVVKPSAK